MAKNERRDFAKEVEIMNDLTNIKNEKLRRQMHKKDEIKQDIVNLTKNNKEFQYYSQFMHSGIDSGRNALLVKKYIKQNYND